MRTIIFIATIFLSPIFAWATPQPKAMICNSKNELIRIINTKGNTTPFVDLWAPGADTLSQEVPSNFLLRSFLESLVLGSGTGLYDLSASNMDVRAVLKELDNPIGIAVRPGPAGCIQLLVGVDARSLVE